jgi:type III pantothenate kinase
MILTIDAGNTRTKWGVFDQQGAMHSHGVWLNAELLQFENLMTKVPLEWHTCRHALVSNVAGISLATVLKAKLLQLDIPAHWAVPCRQAANLLNFYEPAEKLGSDRWLALIAATHEYAVPCVVVNAGTALTVDALNIDQTRQGVFLGGMILPGLSLMQNSLLENAANIQEQDIQMDTLDSFPLNTHSAIYSGALIAISGVVREIYEKFKLNIGISPLCLVSGGDGPVLIEYLRTKTFIESERLILAENLVLRGLYFLKNALTESQSL